jgi:hypothetical protein
MSTKKKYIKKNEIIEEHNIFSDIYSSFFDFKVDDEDISDDDNIHNDNIHNDYIMNNYYVYILYIVDIGYIFHFDENILMSVGENNIKNMYKECNFNIVIYNTNITINNNIIKIMYKLLNNPIYNKYINIYNIIEHIKSIVKNIEKILQIKENVIDSFDLLYGNNNNNKITKHKYLNSQNKKINSINNKPKPYNEYLNNDYYDYIKLFATENISKYLENIDDNSDNENNNKYIAITYNNFIKYSYILECECNTNIFNICKNMYGFKIYKILTNYSNLKLNYLKNNLHVKYYQNDEIFSKSFNELLSDKKKHNNFKYTDEKDMILRYIKSNYNIINNKKSTKKIKASILLNQISSYFKINNDRLISLRNRLSNYFSEMNINKKRLSDGIYYGIELKKQYNENVIMDINKLLIDREKEINKN